MKIDFQIWHYHFFTALGFSHMHQVPSRDEYIQVNFTNIPIEYQGEGFDKDSPSDLAEAYFPYDFESIMHYPTKSYVKNGPPSFVVKRSVS